MYHWKREKMMDYLTGMFAFAIWDEKNQELFCARDRYGEKPFYYYSSNNVLYFAYEMKALFAAGIQQNIDREMVGNFLMNDLVVNPLNSSQTFYSSVKKLPKGCYMTVRENRQNKIVQYYKINTEKSDISLNEATANIKNLLEKSVSLCLRSDVPVGSSLSGGLDSSIIVYLIQQQLQKNHSANKNVSFSARFEEEGYNENEYLNEIINQLQLTNYSIHPSENLIYNNLEKIFYHQEEPFQSASILNQWSVMELAKSNKTIVLLDGQGADETLGGYNWYYRIYLKELYKNSNKEYRNELRKMRMPIWIKFLKKWLG
jgi:asparagine synthase (glutamine-hydrolysing)